MVTQLLVIYAHWCPVCNMMMPIVEEMEADNLERLQVTKIDVDTQPDVYEKMISNVVEVRSRGASVILITNAGVTVAPQVCDHQIVLPEMNPTFAPFGAAVVLQYIAYYAAVHRGLNVDQPRNLAKSVTVE